MTLVKKNKVEKSPHYNEIVTRLSRGESARSVSKWLKNEYDEIISHAALARYNKNHICMEDKVEAELNRRAKEKRKKEKVEAQKKSETEQKIQQKADDIENAEETTNVVAETIADNMSKVAQVAGNFVDDYENMKREADDPESNVSYKDVAKLSLQANKVYADYFKQEDTNVEVNVNNDVTGSLLERVKRKRQELDDLRKD